MENYCPVVKEGDRPGHSERACPYTTPYAKLHTHADVLLDVGRAVYLWYGLTL